MISFPPMIRLPTVCYVSLIRQRSYRRGVFFRSMFHIPFHNLAANFILLSNGRHGNISAALWKVDSFLDLLSYRKQESHGHTGSSPYDKMFCLYVLQSAFPLSMIAKLNLGQNSRRVSFALILHTVTIPRVLP